MNLFDVYPVFDINLQKAKGAYVYDENNQKYLDLYGGHGVISIGHSHPTYVKNIQEQVKKIGFYSNSIKMPLQEELAEKLGRLSGYKDYNLFLCNSGAEANENAIKLASFHNGKSKIIAFKNSFHGRTAATLNVTDNPKLSANINLQNFETIFIELNDEKALKEALSKKDVAAVIVEGIQGVGGLDEATPEYFKLIADLCKTHNALFIADEIQSGYGRSGQFFAHQLADVKADIITTAKGMGNGFPIGGALISPEVKASYGLLGTTFGGNHLACAAGISVLETIENEQLIDKVQNTSEVLTLALKKIKSIKKIKGRGLMLGVEFDFPIKELRGKLLNDHKIFTGASANPNLLRILPPLNITEEEILLFASALKEELI